MTLSSAALRLVFLVAVGATITAARPPVEGLEWQTDFSAFEAEANNATFLVDPSIQWGLWDGWGVSLAWWGAAFGQNEDLAKFLFTTEYVDILGKRLPGLGMNIVRYNLGASGWRNVNGTTASYSPKMPDFKKIEGFWQDWASADPTSSSWDWSADANQVAMLKKAHALGAQYFELFSNSPIWWMCKNHNPAGSDVGIEDNLETWNHHQHAQYMATVAKYAKDHWNITFTSVEPFNEPTAFWWSPWRGRFGFSVQEGCYFHHSSQKSMIPLMRSELDARGLNDMIVSASDESFYDWAVETWKSFDGNTRSKLGRINVHGYQYGAGDRNGLYQLVAGRKLWNTEYGDGDGNGLALAANMHLDFKHLHPTAWCYWQALDESDGWGFFKADFSSKPAQILAVNNKTFVAAQYMRHIRPGMRILESGDSNSVAAYDAKANKLVLVTTNFGPDRWVKYDLSKFSAEGPAMRWTTNPLKNQFYEQAEVSESSNDASMSAVFDPAASMLIAHMTQYSVQTFEIAGVVPSVDDVMNQGSSLYV